MKNFICFLGICISILLSCTKDNDNICSVNIETVYINQNIPDSNASSPYFLVSVLAVKCQRKVETFRGNCGTPDLCLKTTAFEVTNIAPQDMDLNLTIAGQGDFTFSIPHGETISVSPLPDYCAANTWGSVKEIIYH